MEIFIIAAVVGVGVGILSGLLGIGGGVIMVPLFRLGFGLDAIVATATSLFTIIPTSISGMVKHARNKTSVPKIGAVCGLFGACLSPVGVWAASISPAWLIMAVAAVIIAYSAVAMLSKALKSPKKQKSETHAAEKASAGVSGVVSADLQCDADAGKGAGLVGGADAGKGASSNNAEGSGLAGESHESAFAAAFRFTPALLVKTAVIGVFAGFMSGYVGVGGGFVMVPLFISLLGVPMKLASGTSLTAVCILAVPGVIEQALLGNVDFAIGIAMAVGSIPGAIIGANLVKRIPERTLRIFFACFLAVVAVVLVLNEVGVLA